MTWLLLASTPLAGFGFALLVQVSPLGRIPYKPFSCRVCLSGWGSILTAGLLLGVNGELGGHAGWVAGCVAALAGTGGARLLFTLTDALEARGDASVHFGPPVPLPDAVGESDS